MHSLFSFSVIERSVATYKCVHHSLISVQALMTAGGVQHIMKAGALQALLKLGADQSRMKAGTIQALMSTGRGTPMSPALMWHSADRNTGHCLQLPNPLSTLSTPNS